MSQKDTSASNQSLWSEVEYSTYKEQKGALAQLGERCKQDPLIPVRISISFSLLNIISSKNQHKIVFCSVQFTLKSQICIHYYLYSHLYIFIHIFLTILIFIFIL